MALRYDRTAGRFRDSAGHFVSAARGMRSSRARAQFQRAQRAPALPPKPAGPLRYDAGTGRFRDASGHFVAAVRGMRSAPARAQFERVQRREARAREPPRPVRRAPMVEPFDVPTPIERVWIEDPIDLDPLDWDDVFDFAYDYLDDYNEETES